MIAFALLAVALAATASPALAGDRGRARESPIVTLPAGEVGLPGISDQAFGAGDLPGAIREYRRSGRWARDHRRIARRAQRYLARRLRQLRRAGRLTGPRRVRPAIVFDIDDTSLSNYAAFEPVDFRYDLAAFGSYAIAARAPAIVPVRALYREALRRGVRVFFITGRVEALRRPTAENLRFAGFTGRHRLILKSGRRSTIAYKSGERRRVERRGFRILVNIGDQLSDLRGGYADRAFKVPNPMYYLP